MQKNQWSSTGLSANASAVQSFYQQPHSVREVHFAHGICLSIVVQLLSGLNDILNAKLAKCQSSVFSQVQLKY